MTEVMRFWSRQWLISDFRQFQSSHLVLKFVVMLVKMFKVKLEMKLVVISCFTSITMTNFQQPLQTFCVCCLQLSLISLQYKRGSRMPQWLALLHHRRSVLGSNLLPGVCSFSSWWFFLQLKKTFQVSPVHLDSGSLLREFLHWLIKR